MRKLLLITFALTLAGCAQVKPVVFWTCAGCQTLISSGVCAYVPSPRGAVPQCKPGEVLVIENWKDVSRKGAEPVLGCEKE